MPTKTVPAPLRILITSGPTREPLDPVRYLSNASSGRMGAALASEALSRGHLVEMVSGPVEIPPPQGISLYEVTTCLEMLDVCRRLHPSCDVLIGAAAVCDYRPVEALNLKKHREQQEDGTDKIWTVEFKANPDILATLGQDKGCRIHVGFALETIKDDKNAVQRARKKLNRKNLDWIVLNGSTTIGASTGNFSIIDKSGPEINLGELSKAALATSLFDILSNHAQNPAV